MRICIGCGAKESDGIKFHKGRNQCADCRSKYSAKYRKNNKDKIKKKRDEYWASVDQELRYKRVKAAITRSPEAFIRSLVHHVTKKTNSKNKAVIEGKMNSVCLNVDIDYEYMLSIYEKQGGKCVLSDLPMSHQYHDLYSMSIDRINSSLGYIKGNVQLVCKGINLMKNNDTNEAVSEFFDQYFQSRLSVLMESKDSATSIAATCLSKIP